MNVNQAIEQQNQLINVLDIVPDGVLICTKSKNSKIEGLFANFRMNSFFGRNVLLQNLKPVKKKIGLDNCPLLR